MAGVIGSNPIIPTYFLGHNRGRVFMLSFQTVSCDGLLDCKVKIVQAGQGYKASMPCALLAAAVSERPAGLVLDVGCGVAGASLCLAWRFPGIAIHCIDSYRPFLSYARLNRKINSFADKLVFRAGSVADQDQVWPIYDVVMTNPPFYDPKNAKESPNSYKRQAHVLQIPLATWVDFCWQSLTEKGQCFFLFPSFRAQEVCELMQQKYGSSLFQLSIFFSPQRPAPWILFQWNKDPAAHRVLPPYLPPFYNAKGQLEPFGRAVFNDGSSLQHAFRIG